MKIQIRRGLYETNSSSVHTLTIVKPGTEIKTPEFPGDVIKFGFDENGEPLKEEVFDDYWKETTMQWKLAAVYEYCFSPYCNKPVSEFIKRRAFLQNTFEKLGFKCEFNEDPEYMEAVENSRSGETRDWEDDLFEDDEFLLRFVFSDKTDLDCVDRDWLYEHEDKIAEKAEKEGCVMYKCGE